MAYGNVYIFNLYINPVNQFNLNSQGSAGSIAAPAKTTTPPYAPQQLVVARTNLTVDQLNSPLFVVGANSISVNYGGQMWQGTVTIPSPPNPSLYADLWLYVCYQKAFLFDTNGTMIPQQSSDGSATLRAVGSEGNDVDGESGGGESGGEGSAYGHAEGEGGAPAEEGEGGGDQGTQDQKES